MPQSDETGPAGNGTGSSDQAGGQIELQSSDQHLRAAALDRDPK